MVEVPPQDGQDAGGAGVIADIKTFLAFDCVPIAAITSLTFQNSAGVFGAIHQTAESLRAQVLPIAGERRIALVGAVEQRVRPSCGESWTELPPAVALAISALIVGRIDDASELKWPSPCQ